MAIGMTEIKVGPLSMHYFLPLQNAVEADFFRKFAVQQLLFRSVINFENLIRESGCVSICFILQRPQSLRLGGILSLAEWLVND